MPQWAAILALYMAEFAAPYRYRKVAVEYAACAKKYNAVQMSRRDNNETNGERHNIFQHDTKSYATGNSAAPTRAPAKWEVGAVITAAASPP